MLARTRPTCVRRVGSSIFRTWHDVATQGRLGSPDTCSKGPRLLSAYTEQLHLRPRTCAVISSFIAAALGDASAQMATCVLVRTRWVDRDDAEKDPYFSADFSCQRAASFSFTVGSLVGVGGEFWYRHLLRKFPGWTYEVALRTILDLVRFASPCTREGWLPLCFRSFSLPCFGRLFLHLSFLAW